MPITVEGRIEEILESIRPALWADGGDVELLRFDEDRGVVELRLLGDPERRFLGHREPRQLAGRQCGG